MPASRRELRRNDRRAAIVEIAQAFFFEVGYGATTMSDIAAKVGGSKGTLWGYFPTKQALFDAVVDDTVATFRAELSGALQATEDLKTTLQQFCLRLVEIATSPFAISLYRMVSGEAGRFPELGKIFFERGLNPTRVMVSGYLKESMRKGLLREADPFVAWQILFNLCLSGCHQRVLLAVGDPPSAEEKRADAELAVEIFLKNYAVSPE